MNRGLRVLDVKVGGDVKQPRNLRDFVAQFRPQPIQCSSVVRLQRVLILAFVELATEVDVLDRLEKDPNAGNNIGVLAQARGNCRQTVALFAWLERPEHAPPASAG